jgi:hypothetical protein
MIIVIPHVLGELAAVSSRSIASDAAWPTDARANALAVIIYLLRITAACPRGEGECVFCRVPFERSGHWR